MAGRNYQDISGAWGATAIDVSGGNQTLPAACRAIYVGVTGNIAVDMPKSSSITFLNVPVGIFPIQATRILQTGTTATQMFALF